MSSALKKFEVAKYLVEHGADVNVDYNRGYVAHTPFHALLQENAPNLALSLLDHGLDLDAKSYDDQTPLHLAISYYDPDKLDAKPIIQKILELKEGLDIHAKDKKGLTPLCYACQKGDLEIIRWLVEAGADVNMGGQYGKTPLNFAVEEGNVEIVAYLLDQGAHIEPPKEPPLQWGGERQRNCIPPSPPCNLRYGFP